MSYMIMSALLTTTTGVLAYLAGRRDGRQRRHMRYRGRAHQLPEDTQ